MHVVLLAPLPEAKEEVGIGHHFNRIPALAAFIIKTYTPSSPLLLKGSNLIVEGTKRLALELYLFHTCAFFLF